jgi:hypothetical protein
MRRLSGITLVCALALIVSFLGCGGSETPSKTPTAASKPAPPPIPPELVQVAETELGNESEVLVYGDLARNGNQQILVINRLKTTPKGAVPGTLLMRAVVAEKDGVTWKEVFRCDEHLKNPKGFLAGTPIAPVTGWRLQFEQHDDTGLVMYFTPLDQSAGGHVETIGVRWNSKAKRYQSLDRSFEQFQNEAPSLEPIEVPLRR